MAYAFHLTIISVLSLLYIFSSTFAESGSSPFIVAHKRVSHRKLNSDLERVSVSIDIHNAGSDTAYDVTLTDDNWAEEIFDSIFGNTSKTWERLDSGSIVSHSFYLESKVKTVYYGAPALITFRVPTKSNLQEAYSTPILPIKILSDPVAQKKTEIAKKLLTNYGSHVLVFVIVSLLARIIIAPKASGSKKKY
ncbi:hypothetical protein CASFOL_000850 [Castilleja foliolosa]|uniref:Translocon-associated protein subunit beta n=1 Tax=Castilleja foliolosa TaxID=1961234 RepID=A0ABD3ELH2_9LAMI